MKEKLYYPLWRFWYNYNPKQLYRSARYFIQRGNRGWSDRDWWSTHDYLTDIIPPMLRKQATHGIGYPGVLPYDTPKKWSKILLEAADDIEAYRKHDELDFPNTKEEQEQYFINGEKAYKRTQKGMHFVAENFGHLWD